MFKIQEVLRIKRVGIDMFDNPFRAIEFNKGIFIDEKIESICSMFSYQSASKVFSKNETTKEYLIDEEKVQLLSKYAYKTLGESLLGSRLLISYPYDFSVCSIDEYLKRQVIDSCTKTGWKKVYLIDNFTCSAIGSGVPMNDLDEEKITLKNLYVYSNTWCTYVGVIFAGGLFNVQVIEKPLDYVSIDEIKVSFMNVIDGLSDTLPSQFDYFMDESKMKREDFEKLRAGWQRGLHNVYFTVPEKKKSEFDTKVFNYDIIYCTNYDTCIVDGLKEALNHIMTVVKL